MSALSTAFPTPGITDDISSRSGIQYSGLFNYLETTGGILDDHHFQRHAKDERNYYLLKLEPPSIALFPHPEYRLVDCHLTIDEKYKESTAGFSFAHLTMKYISKDKTTTNIVHFYFNDQAQPVHVSKGVRIQIKKTESDITTIQTDNEVSADMRSAISTIMKNAKEILEDLKRTHSDHCKLLRKSYTLKESEASKKWQKLNDLLEKMHANNIPSEIEALNSDYTQEQMLYSGIAQECIALLENMSSLQGTAFHEIEIFKNMMQYTTRVATKILNEKLSPIEDSSPDSKNTDQQIKPTSSKKTKKRQTKTPILDKEKEPQYLLEKTESLYLEKIENLENFEKFIDTSLENWGPSRTIEAELKSMDNIYYSLKHIEEEDMKLLTQEIFSHEQFLVLQRKLKKAKEKITLSLLTKNIKGILTFSFFGNREGNVERFKRFSEFLNYFEKSSFYETLLESLAGTSSLSKEQSEILDFLFKNEPAYRNAISEMELSYRKEYPTEYFGTVQHSFMFDIVLKDNFPLASKLLEHGFITSSGIRLLDSDAIFPLWISITYFSNNPNPLRYLDLFSGYDPLFEENKSLQNMNKKNISNLKSTAAPKESTTAKELILYRAYGIGGFALAQHVLSAATLIDIAHTLHKACGSGMQVIFARSKGGEKILFREEIGNLKYAPISKNFNLKIIFHNPRSDFNNSLLKNFREKIIFSTNLNPSITALLNVYTAKIKDGSASADFFGALLFLLIQPENPEKIRMVFRIMNLLLLRKIDEASNDLNLNFSCINIYFALLSISNFKKNTGEMDYIAGKETIKKAQETFTAMTKLSIAAQNNLSSSELLLDLCKHSKACSEKINKDQEFKEKVMDKWIPMENTLRMCHGLFEEIPKYIQYIKSLETGSSVPETEILETESKILSLLSSLQEIKTNFGKNRFTLACYVSDLLSKPFEEAEKTPMEEIRSIEHTIQSLCLSESPGIFFQAPQANTTPSLTTVPDETQSIALSTDKTHSPTPKG